MKKWIKEKLTDALGIGELQKKNEQLETRITKLEADNGYLKYQNKQIIKDNETIMSQFNISADIYPRENESWAVISIHGKPEYVRFINLRNQDMREIHNFLKQFERNNRVIDSPFTFFK